MATLTRTRQTVHYSDVQGPTLVTVAEAADILGVDVRSIYNYRARGLLTTYKVAHGRAVRLDLAEVYALAAPEAVTR